MFSFFDITKMMFLNCLFFAFLFLSSFLVVSSRNPIHSVLALVSVFLLSSMLLFCLEVEFLALSFVIVYVGAIGILFLFVVMMMDLKFWDNSTDLLNYGPIAYFACFLFFLEITLSLIRCFSISGLVPSSNYLWVNWFSEIETFSNVQAIGQLLYTYYFPFFLMAGFILFIAVIGSLTLTLNLNRQISKF